MREIQKTSRVEVVVDASPAEVWAVVADVTRTGEWSHECRSVEWVGDVRTARPGARFRGRNQVGWIRWWRTCEVLVADPERDLTWRTVPTALFPDSTQWCIKLEPEGGGTRITQSFRVLRAPWMLDRLYARLIPSHQDRDVRLAEDLARIGLVARQHARPT